jgi:hypothetical protein
MESNLHLRSLQSILYADNANATARFGSTLSSYTNQKSQIREYENEAIKLFELGVKRFPKDRRYLKRFRLDSVDNVSVCLFRMWSSYLKYANDLEKLERQLESSSQRVSVSNRKKDRIPELEFRKNYAFRQTTYDKEIIDNKGIASFRSDIDDNNNGNNFYGYEKKRKNNVKFRKLENDDFTGDDVFDMSL